jgi:hypothetical protein
MRKSAVYDDVIYALAVAFSGENLWIEQQAPEVSVHGFLLVSVRIARLPHGIGIRDSDLEAGAALQKQCGYHAGGGKQGAEAGGD